MQAYRVQPAGQLKQYWSRNPAVKKKQENQEAGSCPG
jgi:hypothetical protein